MIGSAHYRQTFLIRFVAYVFIFTGTLTTVGIIEPVVADEVTYRWDRLFRIEHRLPPTVITSAGTGQSTSFSGLSLGTVKTIVPVDTDYGIVIEKINANARVIPDIDPNNERQYSEALSRGVAAVSGSTEPGQPGNLYIFSHSADAPWNIVRFNAIFYLLRELEKGDKVVLFYKGRRYDYTVYDKTVAAAGDVSFLSNRYDKPVLTLQTCDPPGTLLNRMIIRATLD